MLLAVGAFFAGRAWLQRPEPEPPSSTDDPFPGMVAVPAGPFRMGISEERLAAWLWPGENRRGWHPKLVGSDASFLEWLLLAETPEHEATTRAYYMDRYCVTNAQYEVFLRDTAFMTTRTGPGARTIAEVGRALLGRDVRREVLAQIYWRNRDRLEAIRADLSRLGDLPETEDVAAWTALVLPEGVEIEVFTRPVPRHWTRGRVTEEIASLPVVNVSARDAGAFAEWAGKHVPTEEEWEKAARGPEGWLWPWGDEWDCGDPKQKNLLIWLETDPESLGGPAPDTKDRPVAVDALPEGQSGYGCFQMLGNVYQWTSSSPRVYVGSRAEAKPWFGRPDYRVLRGASYGTGMPSARNGELVIRNTARLLAFSPDDPIADGARFESIGFRCAKDPEPGRDVFRARLRRARLPADLAPDLSRSVGWERNAYAAEGEEGPARVYVCGRTEAMGIVPLSALPFAAVSEIKSHEEPVLLGLLVGTERVRFGGLRADTEDNSLFLGITGGRLTLFAGGLASLEPLLDLGETGDALVIGRLGELPRDATRDEAAGTLTLRFEIPLPRGGRDDTLGVTITLPATWE